jgi:hypothetical protein
MSSQSIQNRIMNAKISQNYYFVFVLGMLAWFVSMSPAIAAEKRDNKTYTDWHSMIMYVPFVYGIVNVIIFYLFNQFFPDYANYYFVGIAMALFYSGIGRLSGHAEMYGLSNPNLLHVYAIIMYVILYGIIFNWLDSKITDY